MKHLIVGAGATFGEARALGNAPAACPPLIRDFARKTWSNYTPHPLLAIYLRELGYHQVGSDPRELFYKLEEEGVSNIEHFMEFAWNNRHHKFEIGKNLPPGYISGLRISAPESSTSASSGSQNEFWDDLLYHGIGSPLQLIMIQCFFENGKGWKDLRLSKSVAAQFGPNDLILNLNYDTVFELALEQMGRPFAYSPNKVTDKQLLVCKPHGSLNMVANDTKFTFGQPEWLGMPQPQGYRSYSGLIPPRLNKSYAQHPMAEMILAPVRPRKPQALVMWGIGLTDSDQDLIDLYTGWSEHASSVDIINPSDDVAAKAMAIFNCAVWHFQNVEAWLQGRVS
jgi:SIR2-like domain